MVGSNGIVQFGYLFPGLLYVYCHVLKERNRQIWLEIVYVDLAKPECDICKGRKDYRMMWDKLGIQRQRLLVQVGYLFRAGTVICKVQGSFVAKLGLESFGVVGERGREEME